MFKTSIRFTCIQDSDPAADCKEEWFLTAKWITQRWGFRRTQQNDFFFLYFCYLVW